MHPITPPKDSQNVMIMALVLVASCYEMFFFFSTLSSHSNVCCNKLGRCLVNIYDQSVRNVVLEGFLGNYMTEL